MMWFKFIIIKALAILFRFFPLKTRKKLIVTGEPDDASPVFLTGNFILSVAELRKALKGRDGFIVIAASGGINVWCASTGGHLNNQSVINALSESEIERHVKTRTVILPQLAAAGVEAKVIKKKTGWNVKWGPVYTRELPAYLDSGKKEEPMRKVSFPFLSRMEMAAVVAAPLSIIFGVLSLIFKPEFLLRALFFTWLAPVLIFAFYPFLGNLLKRREKQTLKIIVTLVLALLLFIMTFLSFAPAEKTIMNSLTAAVFSLILITAITSDLTGYAPGHKSSLQAERLNDVVMNSKTCAGEGTCVDVCPAGCFERTGKRKILLSNPGSCVQCGACIIQCPVDALMFRTPDGKFIFPQTLREYKLDLHGKRTVPSNS